MEDAKRYALTINGNLCCTNKTLNFVYKTLSEAQQEAIYLSKEHLGSRIGIREVTIHAGRIIVEKTDETRNG